MKFQCMIFKTFMTVFWGWCLGPALWSQSHVETLKSDEQCLVPNEYVAKLKTGFEILNFEIDLDELSDRLGVAVKEIICPERGYLLVETDNVEDLIRSDLLEGEPDPNYLYFGVADPNDPWYRCQWGLENRGRKGHGCETDIYLFLFGSAVSEMRKQRRKMAAMRLKGFDVEAKEAWDLQAGDATIRVGVVDSGVSYQHPDLSTNVEESLGYDFFDDDDDAQDPLAHGTHVASVIGAEGSNGKGISGVAHEVSMIPIRFIGPNNFGTLAHAIKAIEYAIDQSARVINLSWAGCGFDPQTLREVFEKAPDDVIFVVAAGNKPMNLDKEPTFPAAYSRRFANVMTVAAAGSDGCTANGFTSYGRKTVDLSAPGVSISALRRCNPSLGDTCSMKPTHVSGTSLAAAFVSGVAALVLSEDPKLTGAQVRDILRSSARSMTACTRLVPTATDGLVSARGAVEEVRRRKASARRGRVPG